MRRVRSWVLGAVLYCAIPVSAYAYVDPGSGMLFYQGLVAAIGVAVAIVRRPGETLKRIVSYIRSRLRG